MTGINFAAFLSPGFFILVGVWLLCGWTACLLIDGIEGLRR